MPYRLQLGFIAESLLNIRVPFKLLEMRNNANITVRVRLKQVILLEAKPSLG